MVGVVFAGAVGVGALGGGLKISIVDRLLGGDQAHVALEIISNGDQGSDGVVSVKVDALASLDSATARSGSGRACGHFSARGRNRHFLAGKFEVDRLDDGFAIVGSD